MKWQEYSESGNKNDNLTVKLLFLLNSENSVIHRYLYDKYLFFKLYILKLTHAQCTFVNYCVIWSVMTYFLWAHFISGNFSKFQSCISENFNILSIIWQHLLSVKWRHLFSFEVKTGPIKSKHNFESGHFQTFCDFIYM
jgi:hypothetical protein